MSHDLFQQPPVAQWQENQKTKLSRKWLRNEENMARARRQVELIHEMDGEEENWTFLFIDPINFQDWIESYLK